MFIDQFIGQYLHPKKIHLYISVENSFVSYDYEIHEGRGLVFDWLVREIFVQWPQK